MSATENLIPIRPKHRATGERYWVVEPVWEPAVGGLTAYDLRLAAFAAGLLDNVGAGPTMLDELWEDSLWSGDDFSFAPLEDHAALRWSKRLDRFLQDAVSIGVGVEEAERAVAHLSGGVVGLAGYPVPRLAAQCRHCVDCNAVMGILARCSDGIFVAQRPPDYSWERLLGQSLTNHVELVPCTLPAETVWRDVMQRVVEEDEDAERDAEAFERDMARDRIAKEEEQEEV